MISTSEQNGHGTTDQAILDLAGELALKFPEQGTELFSFTANARLRSEHFADAATQRTTARFDRVQFHRGDFEAGVGQLLAMAR